jgi:hypothetical protein
LSALIGKPDIDQIQVCEGFSGLSQH